MTGPRGAASTEDRSVRGSSVLPLLARRVERDAVRLSILWIDDEPDLMRPVVAYLQAHGCQVRLEPDAARGLQLAQTGRFDMVVLDLMLGQLSGADFLEDLRASRPLLPVIVVTGYGTVENAVDSMRRGAATVKTKPITGAELLAAIEFELGRRHSEIRPSTNALAELAGLLDDMAPPGVAGTAASDGAPLRLGLAWALAGPGLSIAEFAAMGRGLRALCTAAEQPLDVVAGGIRKDLARVSRLPLSLDVRVVEVLGRLRAAGAAWSSLDESDVASLLGMKRWNLRRILVSQVSLTFHGCRMAMVMQGVVHELVSTDEQVAQIAYAAGYDDPARLTHDFTNSFGLPPREYRRLIRKPV